MRPTVYILAILGLAAVLIPAVNLRSERRIWVDGVTGSIKREIISGFGVSEGARIEPSALEVRLRKAHIAWTPNWYFLHAYCGGRVECGTVPPIYTFLAVLEDFARVSSDDDLRTFVGVMQTGSEEEQKAAADAAGEIGLTALSDRTVNGPQDDLPQ